MLQTLCKHPARKARGLHLPEMLVVLMIPVSYTHLTLPTILLV